MNSDKMDDLEEIGIPALPGNARQVELFEKFLDKLEAGRDVDFTQTAGGLKLKVYDPLDPIEEDKRRLQIKLIHRSLAILKAGLGYLVATKSSPIYFEFWVECPLIGGLPPHRWTSLGDLYNPKKCKTFECGGEGGQSVLGVAYLDHPALLKIALHREI